MSLAISAYRKFSCHPNALGDNHFIFRDHGVRGASDKALLFLYGRTALTLCTCHWTVALRSSVSTGHVSKSLAASRTLFPCVGYDYILYISYGTFYSQLKYKRKLKVCLRFHKASQVVTIGLSFSLIWDMNLAFHQSPQLLWQHYCLERNQNPGVSCRYCWVTKL